AAAEKRIQLAGGSGRIVAHWFGLPAKSLVLRGVHARAAVEHRGREILVVGVEAGIDGGGAGGQPDAAASRVQRAANADAAGIAGGVPTQVAGKRRAGVAGVIAADVAGKAGVSAVDVAGKDAAGEAGSVSADGVGEAGIADEG